MSKKILVVGGVAGGASAAARARRLDESANIIMFEKGPDVSFSNCALPYHFSGVIPNCENLVLVNPTQFFNSYNLDARVNSEVIKINRKEKTVIVKNLASGEEYEESYDKLILSPGARPIKPKSIVGIDNENVFTIKNVEDIRNLNAYIDKHNVTDVAIIGGGFIGVETAENMRLGGKNTVLIEAMDQVMNPFDSDMAQILHKELYDRGVELVLGDALKGVHDGYVELMSGKKIKAEAVVMAIGVTPEIELARDAGLEIGVSGGIKVNHSFLTNDKDIYAVGDAIEVFHKLTQKPTRLPLAGPAQRQARAASDHIYGTFNRNRGVIGSSIVRIFDLNAASTGLNEKTVKEEGTRYGYAYVISNDMVALMPECSPMHLKILYECPTGRVLGAQAIGKGNVDKRIDVIATLISMNGTLDDLKDLELCYAPLFGTPKDIVNQAGLVALNIMREVYKHVPVSETRNLVESGAYLVDVREEAEYNAGHLKNAVNIPLSELRRRVDEIPKDRPVYLYCRSSQRSYYAIRALQHLGYDNLYNISGSFLGVCNYEYFEDQISGREKIVTEYNFN